MATKPTTYINWTDGAPTKQAQPPSSQLLSGWTAGEPPPFQWMNWLFWMTDQWIQWLDQNQNLGQPSAVNSQNARLIGGGVFSFVASTGNLAWSAPFNLSIPSIPDADNQAAAGSIVLADGSVAYVQANIPFSSTGTTTSGSNVITSVAYQQGIVVGQTVTGQGVPAATTVVSISGNSVTMSAAATSSNAAAVYTFASVGPLTVSTSPVASLVPSSNTMIIARRVGSNVVFGVNAGQMLLRDQEQKALLYNGFLTVFSGTAGMQIYAGQGVYVSPGGADTGRTAGQIYLSDSSGTVAARAAYIGVATTTASSGQTVTVATDGVVNFQAITGIPLNPGATYYINPSSPGYPMAGSPTTAGQYQIVYGIALNASYIDISPTGGVGPVIIAPVYSVDTYGVANETQLFAALSSCATAGGGIIALTASFSISGVYTVPANTMIEGQFSASTITVAFGGQLLLATSARLSQVHVTTALMAPGVIVQMTGNYGMVRMCRFTLPTGANGTCVQVTGNSNRIYNSIFAGVASGTGVGISYAGGSGNMDDSSVFL